MLQLAESGRQKNPAVDPSRIVRAASGPARDTSAVSGKKLRNFSGRIHKPRVGGSIPPAAIGRDGARGGVFSSRRWHEGGIKPWPFPPITRIVPRLPENFLGSIRCSGMQILRYSILPAFLALLAALSGAGAEPATRIP